VNLKERWCGIGATVLNAFEVDPRYFKNTIDKTTDEETPDYFDLGTKTHMYLLQPEKFKEDYIYLEFTKPKNDKQEEFCSDIAERLRFNEDKDAKEIVIAAYKKSYAVDKKTEAKIKEEALTLYKSLIKYIRYLINRSKYKDILTWSDLQYLREVKQVVQDHAKASKLILGHTTIGDPLIDEYEELEIYWEHPTILLNGEKLVSKSTIDKLIVNHKTMEISLVDLKTSSLLHEFSSKFKEYNYYRQLAFYRLAVVYWFNATYPDKNIKDYTLNSYIAAVQTPGKYKDYPIRCKVFPISEESLKEGLDSIDALLPQIVWHFENNKWDHSRYYYENEGLEPQL
jgi:hypothetical protein